MSLSSSRPANSKSTSFIIQKPRFLSTNGDDKEAALFQVFMEAQEVIWLRAIQNLNGKDLGIDDPVTLEKFKALMILQVHDLYFKRYSFGKALQPVFENLVGSKMKEVSIQDNISPITNLLKLIQEILLPIDSGIPDLAQNTPQSLEQFMELLSNLPKEILLHSLREHAGVFNATLLDKKVRALKQKNIKELCEQRGLSSKETKNILSLHAQYLALYDQFIGDFNATAEHIQSKIPNFTPDTFSTCYTKAFEIFKLEPTVFYQSFLLELNLQKHRKPFLYSDLNAMYLEGNEDIAKAFKIKPLSQEELVTLLNGYGDKFPPSLHEIVTWAHSVLHAPSNVLQPLLTTVSNPKPLLLLQASSTETDAKVADSKSNLTSQQVPLTQQLNTLLQNIEAPLYKSASEIPGHIPKEYNVVKREQAAVRFPNFSELSQEFYYVPSEENDHRKEAIKRFESSLKNDATSVEDVAALCNLAKPCINRHRHYIWDKFTSKKNTDTWKKQFKTARTEALGFLKKEVEELKKTDVEQARQVLKQWHQDSLFAVHRNESTLKAWGRTDAQKEIARMLADLLPAPTKKM